VVATDADLIDAAANARGSPTPSRVDSLEHRRPGRSCTWWRWWLDGPRKPGVGGARRPIMLPSWTTTSRPRRTQMPGCFTRRRIVSAPPSVRATTFGNPRRCPALREVRPGHVTRRPSVERPGRLDRVAAKVVEVARCVVLPLPQAATFVRLSSRCGLSVPSSSNSAHGRELRPRHVRSNR
jgi:hypothetical protein